MKSKLKAICITLGILTTALCFSSCWNSASNNAGQPEKPEITTVLFKGKINADSSLPDGLLVSKSNNTNSNGVRAAGPGSINWTQFEYYVKATSSEGAELTADVEENPETHEIFFEMPLNFGEWTIKTVVRNISTKEEILYDSFTTELLKASPTFSHAFYLKPVSGGKGSIALEISVPASIQKVRMEVQSKPDESDFETEDITPQSNKININRTELTSGVYTVVLTFYDEKSVVYSSVQTLNVLRGLQTTKWLSTSSSTLISNNGSFILSSEIIQAWRSQRTHYYVDYTEGNDTYSGSPLDPFKSLSKTIAIINDVYGNGAKEITISIYNGSTETIVSSIGLSENKKITIQAEDDSTVTLLRDDDYTGAFIEIPSSSELIISNFVIDGKSIEGAENIGIKNQGTLRMTGCTVKNNKNTASDLGAGIYSSTGSTLNINHATLTGNTCSTRGGGIYNAGTAEIEDLELLNSEGLYGAGIFNEGTLTLTTARIFSNDNADRGAGIFNSGNATLNSVTVSTNHCYESGSGIYNEGTLTLNDTNITSNNSDGPGGGIYTCGILNLNSGKISGNKSSSHGAGICIDNSVAAVNITGGIVKDNTLSGGTTKSNLYLPENKKLNISDALKDNSEIWISLGWTPEKINADTAIFTTGYGEKNSEKNPSTVFHSDDNYYVIPLTASSVVEAGIALSGKNFENVFRSYKMTFAIHNGFNKFMPNDTTAANRTIQIDPKVMINSQEITETVRDSIEWKLALYYRGGLVGEENSNVMVIPDTAGYTGRYDLHVYAKYLGLHKDAEFVINGYNTIISVSSIEELRTQFDSITNGTSTITRDTCINLTQDLDLSNEIYYPISAKLGTERILNTDTDFEGVFDGNGHTLKFGTVMSEDFVAVCFRNKGTIQNLIIEKEQPIHIKEDTNDPVSIYPEIKGDKFHSFGGFCHYNDGIIRNCWNKVNIAEGTEYGSVGGICCANYGVIENCINTGNIELMHWFQNYAWGGRYGHAGGISGVNGANGTIRNCVNYGQVWMNVYYDTSSDMNGLAGAIVGCQEHGTSKIENCYWLYECVRSDYSTEQVTASSQKRNWITVIPQHYPLNNVQAGTFISNGTFATKDNGALTNSLSSINGQAQTLDHGTDLVTALNHYVNMVDPNHSYLKEWESGVGKYGYAAVLKQ